MTECMSNIFNENEGVQWNITIRYLMPSGLYFVLGIIIFMLLIFMWKLSLRFESNNQYLFNNILQSEYQKNITWYSVCVRQDGT